MMNDVEFDAILTEIDQLEKKVKEVTEKHAKNKGQWDRKTEAVTDRLAQLAAWVSDRMHNRSCKVDPNDPVYKRSTLRRVRRALNFSY